MSSNSPSRNRWMLPERKGPGAEAAAFLKRPEVWSRVGVCFLATAILWLITAGWAPPFGWRVRLAPVRDLHARVKFEYVDVQATAEAKSVARSKILCLYENDPHLLQDLRQEVLDDLLEVYGKEFEEVEDARVWLRFMKPSGTYTLTAPDDVELPEGPRQLDEGLTDDEAGPRIEDAVLTEAERAWRRENAERRDQFELLKSALQNDDRLATVQKAINDAFSEIDKNGLLFELEHQSDRGILSEIEVYPKGNPENAHRVSLTDIRIPQAAIVLRQNISAELSRYPDVYPDPEPVSALLSDRLLNDDLPVTLTWDDELSRRVQRLAAFNVEDKMREYLPGDTLPKLSSQDIDGSRIAAGVPLDEDDIMLLRAEHDAEVMQMNAWERLVRSLAFFGCYAVTFSLVCGVLYFRDPGVISSFGRFTTIISLITVTMVISWFLSIDPNWRAEVIPIVILAMLLTIAYNVEVSIILSALVAMVFSATHGFGLSEFLILTAASTTTAMLCRRIRSRTTLVYVGLAIAVSVFPTVIGIYILRGQPAGTELWMEAVWYAGACGFAGLFMTALLPFLESWFDIQTDISLLELSDANHPLLKELVQRAPGTYNHSINVASLSEAAAEAIGANGLLCRVGAYFHDIGKIRKPEYFIENQSGENKHDDLEPSMSKMIIIAHVKDGVEIGRKHRLPRRIINLIEQHHGNTLVEYFYHQANKKQEAEDDSQTVDESEFRYPGPRPQTIEAAVMMLADGVESASRTLRDPTPARVESLVRDIGKKKLDDGQFDECGITIRQLNTVQESLIKSLNAMYHARVPYPE